MRYDFSNLGKKLTVFFRWRYHRGKKTKMYLTSLFFTQGRVLGLSLFSDIFGP